MPKIQLAEDWRAQFRMDRDQGADSAILVRVPASIREFLDHVISEQGGSLSELVRFALIDWVLAESTPNLAARRKWLEALAEIHSTSQEGLDADADWSDTDPFKTRQLAEYVRQSDADWARRDRRALQERQTRLAQAVDEEARDLRALEEWKQGAGDGKTFDEYLRDKDAETDGEEL